MQALQLIAFLALAARVHGQATGEASSSGGQVTCGECVTIQEAVHKDIIANISAMAGKSIAGTTITATVEIGQIIWRVCESDTWKAMRLQPSMTSACKRFIKKHVEVATNYWKEKSTEEYQDPTIAMRMKRAVCPNPDVGACRLEQLPDDYHPLRPDECAVCKALVSGVFGLVVNSRDRPTEGKKSDAYYRLVGKLESVCAELPMRHAIKASEWDAVSDVCEELWDDHEGALSRLPLQRDETQAMSLCADDFEICDEPMSRAELYASFAPGAEEEGGGADKDEM